MMNRENQELEEADRAQTSVTDGGQPSQPVAVCGGDEASSSQEEERSENLYITVSDPREETELEFSLSNTYYSYLITTRWNLTEPGSKSRVRRRFRDFKTLVDELEYPLIGGNTFRQEFSLTELELSLINSFRRTFALTEQEYVAYETEEERVNLLQKYLRLLASLPDIRRSDEFIEFLLLNTPDVDGDEDQEFLETLIVLEQYLRDFYLEAEILAKSLQNLGETMGIKLSKFETKAILDSLKIPAADMGKIFVTTESKGRKIEVLEDAIITSEHTNKSATQMYKRFKEIHRKWLHRFHPWKYNHFANMLREFIIKQTHYTKALAVMLEMLANELKLIV